MTEPLWGGFRVLGVGCGEENSSTKVGFMPLNLFMEKDKKLKRAYRSFRQAILKPLPLGMGFTTPHTPYPTPLFMKRSKPSPIMLKN
ncbi:hypothetical protein IQ238_20180 [Pleurocapsales cyanobacterium LEGE 06147]|nr:hypothetical protein [Pleurocapsales cyanobacterium LEGE 06147]